MPDTVLEPPPHTVPAAFTRALLDWLPWLEPLAVEAMTERHMAGLVDAARVKSPYFRLLARDPDALRGPDADRQGHLLQPRCRPAAGRARAGRRRDVPLQRLHLLRLGACALRRDLFEARGRRAAPVGRRRRRRSRRALECHRRGLGGAERDADRVRAGSTSSACVAPGSTIWRSPT